MLRQKQNKNFNYAKEQKQKKFQGCWEFGCAKGMFEKSLAQQIEDEYKNDFDIQIKVQCNGNRADVQPIPLAMYEIEDGQGKDKGMITFAEVIGEVDMDCGKRMKHSKIRWIEESEVEGFSEPAVPDFKNTLKMVFDRLKEGT